MKRYINSAQIYAIAAMAGGVFFREFTKYMGFHSYTTLSVVHTHYFILGMIVFLIMGILEKQLSFTGEKTKKAMAVYHVGLNLTAIMLFVRGIIQVKSPAICNVTDSIISGVAGIGHLLMGISFIILLIRIKQSVGNEMTTE